MNNKKYCILTYGCQMNVHESEKLAGLLEERGYTETDKQEKADIIIFNTCCIRKSAEEKILGNIGAIKPLKKSNPNLIVAVCGCMSQQPEMAEHIKKTFPFVNIIFGTHNFNSFGSYLDNYIANRKRIFEIKEQTKTNEKVPIFRTSGYNGWVNIMYGCNNFCTYCIVPYVRGREISRQPSDILEEVKGLLSTNKYKNITLLGQNVNSYGKDLGNGITFAKLLNQIADLPYDFKLKFMTSHPKDLTDDVIDSIANNSKISKTLHLPVQSGSNRILKMMNRNYTVEHYLQIIDKVKTKIPNIFLTSDFIVGFPSETEEDFEATCNLVRKVEYNNIFAFMYSPRQGTPASKYENQIDAQEKNRRVNKLLTLEKEISKQKTKEMLGTVENCIVEKILDDHNTLVKTDSGKTIIVNDNKIKELSFVNIKIEKIFDNQLYGTVVQ